MGVRNWGKKPTEDESPAPEVAAAVDSEADPFAPGGSFDTPAIPRISPATSPSERKALVNELRGLVQSGEYQVDAEVVALAVMNADGRMIAQDDE